MSINWLPVEVPLLVTPPAAASLDEAHAAIELWEHYSRKRLDPSQRLVVEVMMAQAEDGKWAASTTGREMSRQNGKGDEVEVVELWGLVQRSEAILHTVHDAVLLASQTQQRMLGVLEGHGDLRRLVKRKWQGTGQQMIEMRNGGAIWYRTRTAGGGRGVDDVDRLVVDEAQHATEDHLAAVAPTLLANSNPQMNVMGTAGIAGVSKWWWSVRKRALMPDPGAFGYVGHTAERLTVVDGQVQQHPVDVEDRRLWPVANPAVVAGRGQGMVFLEEQLRRLGPGAFAREHLGVWDPEPDRGASAGAFPLEVWDSLATTLEPASAPAFGVAVAPDRSWAAIGAACRRSDGAVQVFIPTDKAGRLDYRAGASWVPDRVAELTSRWGGSVLLDTAARGLVAGDEPSQAQQAQAHNALADAVEVGGVRHGNEPALNVAVRSARWRPLGDTRVLDRKGSADISPLIAVALAAHGLTTASTSGGWMVSVR